MNIYSVIGFLIALGVFMTGLFLASPKMGMFLDYPSMFIVVGGTIAATSISFQLDRIVVLFRIFYRRVIMGQKPNYRKLIREIMRLSEEYRKNDSIEGALNKVEEPFLKEALTLVSDNIMEKHEVYETLNERLNNMHFLYMEEANKIRSVGKFPPAFGMMGTTIGMIVLLSNLGGKDAMKMIGPAMAVCLITTLYGVAIANLAIIPIAENLTDSSKEIFLRNKIIVEGTKLLLDKTNPVIVAEKLNSFLPPAQRLDWKQALGK